MKTVLLRLFLASLAVSLAIAARQPVLRANATAPTVMLPNGWVLNPPHGAETATGTMPQGMAVSPDGSTMAVIESGYNPATLGLYRIPDLSHVATIALPGAFGRPLWLDDDHVLVPGANADALLDVEVRSRSVARIAFPKHSYPALVATSPDGSTVAVASDADGAVRIGNLTTVGTSSPISIAGHPGGITFSPDGKRVFVSVRSGNDVVSIDVASHRTMRVHVGLHPSALAVHDGKLYVAVTDADTVAVVGLDNLQSISRIFVGDAAARAIGVSPNAIAVAEDTVYVSLGAANSVAILRDDRLARRIEAGWYPTDVARVGQRLYVLDGKGEGARPNPQYRSGIKSDRDYIGAIEFGSIRAYDLDAKTPSSGSPQGSKGWAAGATSAVVRPRGPIRHVFFVLKENRTYDQVLGDMRAGNGDASLTWFGAKVTPNEHALAKRFGLFDNSYASGEVSDAGHMWSDTGFANDYVERFWPPSYGNRRDLDDLSVGNGARVPTAGFIWDAARRAHVSFRDYGELVDPARRPSSLWVADVPSLQGRFDPRYAGWDLDYSDLDRVKEWRREFATMDAHGGVPQFEFIWLPNDHTYGSKAGKLTPSSYVATNDYALGEMVDTLSHSKVWRSSAMFVIEDDAQDGADHVSDQRTTMFVVSPYARGGVRHEHYATVSVLRTIEIILGMQPLSAYDAMAVPMLGAFGSLDARAFSAIAPQVDLTQRNRITAYGSAVSAKLNFTRADAVPDGVLEDILAHNH